MPSRNDAPTSPRTRSTSSGRTPSSDAITPGVARLSSVSYVGSGTAGAYCGRRAPCPVATASVRVMWARRIAPSVVTLAGLFLAFWSITLAQDGRFHAAAWVIFAAACADVIDGGLARASGSISPFGKQLDSLVDLVAAGVAPAFLVHQVYFDDWGVWGVAVAFAWVAFVAIRLARFNTSV